MIDLPRHERPGPGGVHEDPPGETADDDTANRERLARVRQELLEYRPDILNDELRHAVTMWLLASSDIPTADTEDYITSTLMRLRDGNAMYEQATHSDGSEAFPDICEGCPHYGIRCPVITDVDERKRRERIMNRAGSSKELRREMKEYAIDNECQVLLNVIDELSESVEPLLASGRKLLMAVEESVLFTENDTEVAAILDAIDSLEDLDTANADLTDLAATADLERAAEDGDTPSLSDLDDDDAMDIAGRDVDAAELAEQLAPGNVGGED
jgi:hypothetical protein